MTANLHITAFILIFFFILLPGFTFRRLYYRGEFSKQVFLNQNYIPTFVYSFIVGVLLNILVYSVIYSLNYKFSEQTYSDLFNISTQEISVVGRDAIINKKVFFYLSHLSFISIIGGLFGYILNYIIRYTDLDKKIKLFRFKNSWYYLFSGDVLKYQNGFNALKKRYVKYTFVDVKVSEGEGVNSLYSGLYADHTLKVDSVDALDKLYLFKTSRYKKVNDRTEKVFIPGDIFCIKAENIININCKYIFELKNQKLIRRILVGASISFHILSSLIYFSLVVAVLFRIEININIYTDLLSLDTYRKLIILLWLNQIIFIIPPFKFYSKDFKYIGNINFLARIIVVLFLSDYIFGYVFFKGLL